MCAVSPSVAAPTATPDRLRRSSSGPASSEQASAVAAVVADEEIVVQEDGPSEDEVMFQRALLLVKRKKWDQAGGVLQTFLRAHPDSRWQLEAMYLLGECLFYLERYSGAVRQYQQVVDRDERGEWAARAMFKQGLSFAEMDRLDESKVFLSDLIRLYPGSPEAKKARMRVKADK